MSFLILASASSIRARLLREAGVSFGVRPAEIDEDALKTALLAKGTGKEEIADLLAEQKALQVSKASPQALVLGCDQILLCGNHLFDKAHDLAEARATLHCLRGNTHSLITSCALVRNGTLLWRHRERASLRMRSFSNEFLEAYLKTEGSNILGSVGCYQFEGFGAQLFDQVKGDFFAILGLPLVPLLGALREHGIMLR
jgi:septum formation protein